MAERCCEVLIVEDEADLAATIGFNLRQHGYTCREAHSGDEAWEALRTRRPDLVILDRMLPGLSGDDVLRRIRSNPETEDLPVLMLTAKVAEAEELVGLALGADDYLPKPCTMPRLIARVEALLRRVRPDASAGPVEQAGPIRLDASRYEVHVSGRPVRVTATEFRILEALMAARGRVCSRPELIEKAIGPDVLVTGRTIDVHITSLRKKLHTADPEACADAWIVTVRGVGYACREPAAG